MVKRSGLSLLANRPEPEVAPEPELATPEAPASPAAAKRTRPKKAPDAAVKPSASRYAGQVHVGASYDETDDTVEGFRHLVFKTRRSSKDLLHEAMQLLVAKYDKFKPPV